MWLLKASRKQARASRGVGSLLPSGSGVLRTGARSASQCRGGGFPGSSQRAPRPPGLPSKTLAVPFPEPQSLNPRGKRRQSWLPGSRIIRRHQWQPRHKAGDCRQILFQWAAGEAQNFLRWGKKMGFKKLSRWFWSLLMFKNSYPREINLYLVDISASLTDME